MPTGPGKYDHLCTYVREQANAEGAAVIVFNGSRGSGFSLQGTMRVQLGISDMLDYMAREIRKSLGQPQTPNPDMLILLGAVRACLDAGMRCDLPAPMAKPMQALAEAHNKLAAKIQ
jgi:hypothetical protein